LLIGNPVDFWSFDFWRSSEKNVFGDQNRVAKKRVVDRFGAVKLE
jgi:hypothetical protein